jgi:signal transduction histidine kinase
MKIRAFRQPFLLFIVAVIVPGLILTAFTLQMIRQEKKLAGVKVLERRQRTAEAIGNAILNRLRNIQIQIQIGRIQDGAITLQKEDSMSGIILVARVMEYELKLPWENQGSTKVVISAPSGYQTQIEAGERAEFSEKNLQMAEKAFRQAMVLSNSPIYTASARLGLARILMKDGRLYEALEEYLILLETPITLTDEFGIPISYFAASRLLEFDRYSTDVVTWLAQNWAENLWMSPIALSKLADIIAVLRSNTLPTQWEEDLVEVIQALERAKQRNNQALKLKDDFIPLVSILRERNVDDQGTRWTVYGNVPWFITVGPSEPGNISVLLAVDALRIWNSSIAEVKRTLAFPGGCRLDDESTLGGIRLSASLPGVRVLFDTNEPSEWAGSSFPMSLFYVLSLSLVFGVTGFGTYLLWRDMRRDYRSAELRAQFVSNVSHELKTPLTSIRMFAEALALKRPRAEAEKSDYLRTIVSETERLSRLINNVLDFSKIEQGKRTYRMESVSLENVVKNTARTMAYPLEQQGFRLRLSVKEKLPEIRADSDALEQALLNLLHNAVKYSGDSRDIELRIRRREDCFAIEVEDHGIGIGPNEKENICNKYYRTDAAVNSRTSGAGLGLSIVNHIVKAHQGRLEIESELGHGSVFSIIIPLSLDEKET